MKKTTEYKPVETYLNDVLGLDVDYSDILKIVELAVLQDGFEANKGYKFERTKHNEREMAFYLQWLQENEPKAYLNNGNGILQDLFIEREGDFPSSRKWVLEINNRDRFIVATIIQWLGTNVGMCFLEEALKRFGAHIAYSK